MTVADQIDAHRARSEPMLLRLRILVGGGEVGAALPQNAAAEVREATNAVIAEAEVAGRAALAAMADTRGELAAETFLWVRLARLAAAADEAVSAACTTDAHGMRQHLHRFSALASVMWEVQDAVYGQMPLL